MRSSVIAIVLCLSAAAANAQCAAAAGVAASARTGPELIKTSTLASHAPAPAGRAGSGQALPMDDEPPTLHEAAPASKPNGKQPHRAGPAMLLATVAVMSGIALRRYSARA